MGNNGTAKLQGVPKIVSLHVFRSAPATALNDVLEFLKPSFPEITGEQLTSRHPEQYASFRIDVYEDNVQKAMDPGLWPSNTRVRHFLYTRQKTEKG